MEKGAVKKIGATPSKLTSRKKAMLAAQAGLENKAADPVIIRVGDLIDYTDYFVIMHGESMVQVQAIVEGVIAVISGSKSPNFEIEGETERRWVVIDWGDVIVHAFLKELREFYELEKLWADAPRVKISGRPGK